MWYERNGAVQMINRIKKFYKRYPHTLTMLGSGPVIFLTGSLAVMWFVFNDFSSIVSLTILGSVIVVFVMIYSIHKTEARNRAKCALKLYGMKETGLFK